MYLTRDDTDEDIDVETVGQGHILWVPVATLHTDSMRWPRSPSTPWAISHFTAASENPNGQMVERTCGGPACPVSGSRRAELRANYDRLLEYESAQF
jgi:hypothetical protein